MMKLINHFQTSILRAFGETSFDNNWHRKRPGLRELRVSYQYIPTLYQFYLSLALWIFHVKILNSGKRSIGFQKYRWYSYHQSKGDKQEKRIDVESPKVICPWPWFSAGLCGESNTLYYCLVGWNDMYNCYYIKGACLQLLRCGCTAADERWPYISQCRENILNVCLFEGLYFYFMLFFVLTGLSFLTYKERSVCMFQTFVPPSPVGVQAVGERRHFSPRPLATSNGRYLRVPIHPHTYIQL